MKVSVFKTIHIPQSLYPIWNSEKCSISPSISCLFAPISTPRQQQQDNLRQHSVQNIQEVEHIKQLIQKQTQCIKTMNYQFNQINAQYKTTINQLQVVQKCQKSVLNFILNKNKDVKTFAQKQKKNVLRLKRRNNENDFCFESCEVFVQMIQKLFQ
ncbi:Hypothetical_protein [Hexamita inflata]|uniref:Hypothetical_protein n=1 Tax=Hexamita inflata TaxID=28002 RepID=A0AA86UYK2_9EUKA|nr:Hypothetical protein HINF_LOCUS60854 [Hexamita inflata]